MCAIFGIGFTTHNKIAKSKPVIELVNKLFLNSQERGRKATGIAIVNRTECVILKRPFTAKKFIEMKEYKDLMETYIKFDNKTKNFRADPTIILGHCRLDTKGSTLNNNNNHPIIAGNIIGTHNGIIQNDDELFAKFSKDLKNGNGIHRQAEVDSEIIFRLIDFFAKTESDVTTAIKKATAYLTGSFACSCVSSANPHYLYLFRANNPVRLMYHENLGMFIFSTSDHFIKKAESDLYVGKTTNIPIDVFSAITINLHSGILHRYKLNDFK